jgi:hypothetical protein
MSWVVGLSIILLEVFYFQTIRVRGTGAREHRPAHRHPDLDGRGLGVPSPAAAAAGDRRRASSSFS